MILDECTYNVDNLRDIVEWDYTCLNADQRVAFDALYQAVASSERDMFFLDEFDDIEKIFLINLILMKIQSDEDIALTTTFSDITATLLNESTTTHSRFKISIDINSDSICNILAQSHLAKLI